MQSGWRARFRLVLAMFIMLAAMPLALPASAEDATPVPPDTESTATTGDTSGGADPTMVPTTAPEPTRTPTATAQGRSIAPASDAIGTDVAPDGNLQVMFEICGNDDRVGDVEYVAIGATASLSASTSYDCRMVPSTVQVDLTIESVDTGRTSPASTLSSAPLYLQLPVGDAVAHLSSFNDASGNGYVLNGPMDSKPFSIAQSGTTQLAVLLFVPQKAQPAPSGEGTGSVSVVAADCQDDAREGTTEFYEAAGPSVASADTATCSFAPDGSEAFTLTNAADPTETYGPVSVTGSGVALFTSIPYGQWIVTSESTGSTSAPITLGADMTTDANVTALRYFATLPEYVDLYVEKTYCQDDTRAGTTDFLLDTYNGNRLLAASDTCYAEPPLAERPELTVTLDNQDTGASFRQTLDASSRTIFFGIPAGTYVATESDGDNTATSDPFAVPGDSGNPRLRIIDYTAGETVPAPDTDGDGGMGGMLLFCAGEGRDGDVEFIVQDQSRLGIAAVSTCEVAEAISGQLTLYPLTNPGDPDSERDIDAGVALDTSGGEFGGWSFPGGYYVLGYASPSTGEVLSKPFAIDASSSARVDVNVFTEPFRTGVIEVWKDVCVDPDRAGEAAFQISEPDVKDQVPAIAANAAPDCRYSTQEDGEYVFTLTNVETGATWTASLIGDGSAYVTGLPAGTYTITEDHAGSTLTSDPFGFEPDGYQPVEIYARNFIAEADWTPVPDDEDSVAEVEIRAYTCADAQHDGGGEFFQYTDEQMGGPVLAVASSMSSPAANCTADDGTGGFSFTAEGQGETSDGRPLPDVTFAYSTQTGSYVPDSRDRLIPEGDYIVTETTTGISSGVVNLSAHHDFDVLVYDELPTSNVTIDVSSSAPGIAGTLPVDATWTVTQADGTPVGGDTFAAEHLELPSAITVTRPVTYGDYVIGVDAGPTFAPYTADVSIDSATQTVKIVLDPVTVATVSLTVVDGASPALADPIVPAGTSWSIAGTADDDTPVDISGTIDAQQPLPYTFAAAEDVPFGTYTLILDAGENHEFYSTSIIIDTPGFAFDIPLVPITESQVTIDLSSSAPEIASTMPAGATWTVTLADGTPVDSDVFASDDLALPTSIAVENPAPYGDYVITIDAGPTFAPYTAEATIDTPIQTVGAELDPATTSSVTLTIVDREASALVGAQAFAARAAATVPAGSIWTISGTDDDGTPVDLSGTIDTEQPLPYTFEADEAVPFGSYVLTFDAGPDYEFYSTAIVIDAPGFTFDIPLVPIIEAQVTLDLSSSDPELANTLPEGASWTLSTTDGSYVERGTLDADRLALPSSVAIAASIPYGEYLVSINGLPVFQSYQTTHVIDAPIQELDIALDPADAPATITPEPTQAPTEPPATATVTPSATQAPATATQAPTKTAVSALPNTGQGAGGGDAVVAITLLLVALALAALGLLASRRRWSARP